MPGRGGFYLRPETPCGTCDRPFAEHDVTTDRPTTGRRLPDFEGLTLSYVYCPETTAK